MGHDVGAPGIAQARPLVRIRQQGAERVGERHRVSRWDEPAGCAVDDHLGDRRDRAGDHGHAGSHRLEDHVGDPVAVAVGHDHGCEREDRGSAVFGKQLGLGARTDQLHPVLEPESADQIHELGPLRPVAADDAREGDASSRQLRTGPHEHVEALLGHESPDAQYAALHRLPMQALESRELDPVPAHQDLLGAHADRLLHVTPVRFCARDHQLRCFGPGEHVVGGRGVQVLGVGGEAVRDTAHEVRQVSDGGGAVGEVRVQVTNTQPVEITDEDKCLSEVSPGGGRSPPARELDGAQHARRVASRRSHCGCDEPRPRPSEISDFGQQARRLGLVLPLRRVHEGKEMQLEPLTPQLEELVEHERLRQPGEPLDEDGEGAGRPGVGSLGPHRRDDAWAWMRFAARRAPSNVMALRARSSGDRRRGRSRRSVTALGAASSSTTSARPSAARRCARMSCSTRGRCRGTRIGR